MFKNYIKIAWRNLVKHRPYSYLNLAGLSFGLCVTFIVLLYINEELGFDKQHVNVEKTYRLIANDSIRQTKSAKLSYQVSKILAEKIPEIEFATNYTRASFSINNLDDLKDFYYADNTITDVFTFNFIQGSEKSFIKNPTAILISEYFAKNYGNFELMAGSTIEMVSGGTKSMYTISGIFKNFDRKSSFRPELVVPIANAKNFKELMLPKNLGYQSFDSYLVIKNNTSTATITKKINEVINSFGYFGKSLILQPLADVHLYSDDISGSTNKGSIKKITIYSIIGLLILVMSFMNFIMLNTSITKRRFKELAVRKINGLSNKGLLNMFLTESIFLCVLSSILALLFMYLTVPLFNDYTNSVLQFNWIFENNFFLIVLTLNLLITLLSGLYFYNFVSNTKNIEILSLDKAKKSRRLFLGDSAMVFQLVIVTGMIIFSFGFEKQLDFIMNTGKGFDSDNVLMLSKSRWDSEFFENEIKKFPIIEATSRGQVLPSIGSSRLYDVGLKNKQSETFPMEFMEIDENYIPLYKIKLLNGRNFSTEYADDINSRTIIINESALGMLSLKNPIGMETTQGTIVGVVEDFKFESFHNTLRPLFFRMHEKFQDSTMMQMFGNSGFTLIKYKPGDREETITIINELMEAEIVNVASDIQALSSIERREPFVIFNANYYETFTDRIYGEEKTLKKLVFSLTLISIFLALLGLIGMSLYKASRKTKEIGIRKVNGADTKAILLLLNKSFLKRIFLAFIIAIPIGTYTLQKWLEGFAYKIPLYWEIYAYSMVLVLLTAFFAVSLQSFKAARQNPVNSLRSE